MKKLTKKYYVILCLLIIILSVSCKKKSHEYVEDDVRTHELRIYCYDSFASSGLGKKIIPIFEEMYDCKVTLESTGSGGTILNRLILEKDKPLADVAIGINNSFMHKALAEDIFLAYEPKNIVNIKDENLLLDSTNRLIPFDYNYYAFVYDSEVLKKPPLTFGEMQSSIWKDKIIFIDPRTSSAGYGLLVWTLSVYGDRGFDPFWRSIKDNILTTPSSWGEAYSAFLAGEAPIVLSYATSPAYHIEYDNTDRYKAFIPEEGGFREVEFAGIVKGSRNTYLAKKFIEFMLTEDFQKHIPKTQWMMPVIENVAIPESFSTQPVPARDLSPVAAENADFFSEKWIDRWINIMTSK